MRFTTPITFAKNHLSNLLVISVVGALLCSCQKEDGGFDINPNTDYSVLDNVKVIVKSDNADSEHLWGETISTLDVLTLDSQNELIHTMRINGDEKEDDLISFRLYPGLYKMIYVANGTKGVDWDYIDGDLTMSLTKSLGSRHYEANDFFSYVSDLEVGDDDISTSINLERNVAMLRIEMSNIPNELSNIKFRISNTPLELVNGIPSETVGIIEKDASQADNNGNSVTEIRVFPSNDTNEEVLSVIYTYNGTQKISNIPINQSFLANTITKIRGSFTQGNLINVQIGEPLWSSSVLEEDDFELFETDPIFIEEKEMVLGENLLINGSFEVWENVGDNLSCPEGWKFDGGGKRKIANSSTDYVLDGLYSAALGEQTYLWQDIDVIAGHEYKLTANINSPTANTKWKVYYAWKIGSSSSDIDEDVFRPGYSDQTDGDFDPFEGRTFIAPEGATKLRVEVRTYTIENADYIYLDNFAVQEVTYE